MTTGHDDQLPPKIKSRPGPKARGRTVVPLTITITPRQRAALETMADAEGVSISTVIRRFITVGLVASALYALTTLIETTLTRRAGAEEDLGGNAHPSRRWSSLRVPKG